MKCWDNFFQQVTGGWCWLFILVLISTKYATEGGKSETVVQHKGRTSTKGIEYF